MGLAQRRKLVDREHPSLSMTRHQPRPELAFLRELKDHHPLKGL